LNDPGFRHNHVPFGHPLQSHKIDDRTALVLLFDVNLALMEASFADPGFPAVAGAPPAVASRDVYVSQHHGHNSAEEPRAAAGQASHAFSLGRPTPLAPVVHHPSASGATVAPPTHSITAAAASQG